MLIRSASYGQQAQGSYHQVLQASPFLDRLRAKFDVDYRPKLVDDEPALAAALAGARAWIVRNRTQVRGKLLEAYGVRAEEVSH